LHRQANEVLSLDEISETTGISSSTLFRIRHGLRPTVQFGTADRLLTGIGRPDVWHSDAGLYAIFAKTSESSPK